MRPPIQKEPDIFVVDADSHVLEPPGLWEEYLESKYKDRAIRVVRTPQGIEQLLVDNEVVLPAGLAGLGGVDLDIGKRNLCSVAAIDHDRSRDRHAR